MLVLVNFALAVLFLLSAGLVTGHCCSALRLISGAGIAAVSSLSILLPTLPVPLALLYKVSSGALSVAAAYGWQGVRGFGQLLVWFWLMNLLLTGAALLPGAEGNNFSTYLPLSPGLLLSSAAGIYLILQTVLHFFGKTTPQCVPAELILESQAEAIPVNALYDTGFSVQEPLSCREVVLVRYQPVKMKLPSTLRNYLAAQFSGSPELPPPELGIRFVPCSTVSGHCVLPAVPARELRIHDGSRVKTRRQLYAAFCDTPPPPGGWTLLMGG